MGSNKNDDQSEAEKKLREEVEEKVTKGNRDWNKDEDEDD